MALRRWQYWGILTVGVVVFMVVDDVWSNPFAIDASIVWSYAIVAALIPIALVANQTFKFLDFALLELELILLKYAITTCIAVGFWATSTPPATVEVAIEPTPPPAVRTAPPPSVIDWTTTATIEGIVTNADGPVAGALVFVDSGLEALAFAAPTAPLILTNGGLGLEPRIAVLHTHQALHLEVGDGQLHTIEAITERGERAFSIPMVAAGRARPFLATRELGLLTLKCRVHERDEAPARLAVLAHPFHTITAANGSFSLTGVPGRRLLTIRSFDGTDGGREALRVGPGARHRIVLRLGAEPETSKHGDAVVPLRIR